MNNYLPTLYQQVIYLSRYSRFLWDKGRRETWPETIKRYFDFFEIHLGENYGYKVPKELRQELESMVLTLQVMPSMRCLMTAGEALEKNQVSGYNCSYLTVDRVQAFDETMWCLMAGTGVGFSVERQYINNLPTIAEDFYETDTTIVVGDSKLGWCKALKEIIGMLYIGQIPKWDLSKVRPAGAPLKTHGGRASGPGPLDNLFKFAVALFKKAKGRKLNSLECHDLICKIAEVIIVGGVRRSALISLSNLSDDRMRAAKTGQWWEQNPQRALANNSAVYTERPEIGVFMDEWKSLYDSKSGERGIFCRYGAQKHIEANGRRNPEFDFGVNPCSEILLRYREFCNLSEVILRYDDTIESIKKKIWAASILGTWQSTLTNFKYLSSSWKNNCEEERLLGVSLTGIRDCPLTNGTQEYKKLLTELKEYAIEINKTEAKRVGINPSVAVTTVKPSGTVSQLVCSSSGIHPAHAPFYIRTIRSDKMDPLAQMMIKEGFPVEDDVLNPNSTYVFSFPIEASQNSIFRKDVDAISQLNFWLDYKNYWCEHTASITVSVKEEEWLDVAAWVYKNFDALCGVSFLPYSDHVYRQAPYTDCTEEEFKALQEKLPKEINWKKLVEYETTDMTTGSQELACTSGYCEI